MDKQTKKPFETIFREWTQTILLLFAGAWGVYSFIYKEIVAPKSAPINISMTLEARQLGVRDVKGRTKEPPLQAIELKITARNPSTRNINLLRSLWMAEGTKVARRDEADDDSLKQEIIKVINEDRIAQIERYRSIDTPEVVATGGLFVDDVLRPGELITRTLVFVVPRGAYDLIEVSTRIPSVAVPGIDLQWEFPKELEPTFHLFRESQVDFSLKSILFRWTTHSPRTEIQADKKGNFTDNGLEYQMAESRSSISLWR